MALTTGGIMAIPSYVETNRKKGKKFFIEKKIDEGNFI